MSKSLKALPSKLVILIFTSGFVPQITRASQLCNSIVWTGTEVVLDDFHRRMVCGDEENPAWSKIPLYQASYHLRAYLESMGYLDPEIYVEGSSLMVDAGKKFHLKEIHLNPPSKELNRILEKYINSILNPDSLNELENRADMFYKNRGYACVSTEAEASIQKSVVVLTSSLSSQKKMGDVQIKPQTGYNMSVLRRYYSFQSSTPYSLRSLRLARKRIDEANVVSGNYFESNCFEADAELGTQSEKPFLVHNYTMGPPRVLRFGFGADTEVGPYVYGKWEHNRVNSSLSKLQAQVSLSLEEQSLETKGQFYPLDSRPRLFYTISPKISREERKDFEEIRLALSSRVGYQWDFDHTSLRVSTGPDFEYANYDQVDSTSRLKEFSTGLVLDTLWQAHRYELNNLHPPGGFYQFNRVEIRTSALGYFTNLLMVENLSKQVLDLGYCGRGDCYLALRQHFKTTWLADSNLADQLAPSLQSFLGDVRSLRGYSIEDLNNPALTQASLGIDLRHSSLLWPAFEPYLLSDLGALGTRSWSLERESFFSAGVGLRWFSPIGIVNGFITRSIPLRSERPSAWYFYLGLGGGF